MTPAEYREAVRKLGLTLGDAAELCGAHPVTGRGTWTKSGPPPGVAKLLRLMLAGKVSVEDVREA